MKKQQHSTINLIISSLIFTFLLSCDKSNTISPATPGTVQCFIQNEATALVGNNASWKYEYDANGMPSKVTKLGPTNIIVSVLEVSPDKTVVTIPNSIANRVVEYDVNLFQKKLPTIAKVSNTDSDGTIMANYQQYLFSYDAQSRLVKVREQTTFVGDSEWELTISYNDKNNVTDLQYEWVSGPITGTSIITATAYDDKPTPYAAISFWKFISSNFAWDNYDPEPVLTALSSNNPLNYTLGSGSNKWERTMTYTYNENGFPLTRTNTNKNASGEYTFVQTFSYECH